MNCQIVFYEGYDVETDTYQVRLSNGRIERVPRQTRSLVMISTGQRLLLVKLEENSPGYLIPIL